MLMGEGVQAIGAVARQQLRKAGRAAQVLTQDQGVDEETQGLFELGAVAIGHRAADADVVASAQPLQQRLEAGEQGHEQGGVGGEGQLAQRVDQRGRQRQADVAGFLAPALAGGVIAGQLHFAVQAGEAFAPVAQRIGVAVAAGAGFAFPFGKVGVLQRLGQGRHG
nr:hypothetical protein [Chromobacterium haemolyticum]